MGVSGVIWTYCGKGRGRVGARGLQVMGMVDRRINKLLRFAGISGIQ